MSKHTGLTLLTHTELGNLVFQANDDTVYVCREAMHGAEVWKSNHGGYLNTAGTLSTNHNGFGLNKTACRCCGNACICPECRCTDLELETDFRTSGPWKEWAKDKVAAAAAAAKAAAAGAGNALGKASDAVTKRVAAASAGIAAARDHLKHSNNPPAAAEVPASSAEIQEEIRKTEATLRKLQEDLSKLQSTTGETDQTPVKEG
jgi:hypothetical protein